MHSTDLGCPDGARPKLRGKRWPSQLHIHVSQSMCSLDELPAHVYPEIVYGDALVRSPALHHRERAHAQRAAEHVKRGVVLIGRFAFNRERTTDRLDAQRFFTRQNDLHLMDVPAGCCCVRQCSVPSPQTRSTACMPTISRSGISSASVLSATRSLRSLNVGTSTTPLAT